MKKINQWVTRFQSLDPGYQLQIAEAIIGELNLNEDSLDDDEYDKDKSQLVHCLFDEYIKIARSKAELQQLQELFNRFDSLSDEDQKGFISQVFDSLAKYCDEVDERETSERIRQEQMAKSEFCQINGHDFGDWKRRSWTSLEEFGPSGIEALYTGVGTTEVKRTQWIRTCKHCGYVQRTKNEPDEVKANRIKGKIKSLQKSLDNLNNQ